MQTDRNQFINQHKKNKPHEEILCFPPDFSGGGILPCRVVAQRFTVDGIRYSITSAEEHTVAVMSGYEYAGSVVIPESVAYDGMTYSVTTIGNSAFSSCSGLTSITIPNSVTSIGSGAFQSCSGLTSITIPNSLTSIGNSAFDGCSGLTSITIPNSVTTINNGAFHGCSSLTSITIPNSVTKIYGFAFSGCSGLTSITIPNSVTAIERDAFEDCSGLECIIIDAGNPVYDSRENCNAIIKTSWNTLIYGCKNTIIPNSVTTIGEWAFSSCHDLISITIPNSVTTIGNNAFSYCYALTSITIPNSVTTIGDRAFNDCSGLISITIPNSVTTIGNNAFSWCSALKDFYCHAESVPTVGYNIFYNVNISSATLHVPEASFEVYSTKYPWNSFGQIVALDESDGIERLTSEANRPTTAYGLDGRRVAKPRKGIYVIGGRKTVVR